MSPHRPARPAGRHYPRMARVNEVLREVVAEAIEAEAGGDPSLELLTVTAVDCDPDLRHATVLLASLPGPAHEALSGVRARLQAAIARQVRLKRTPQLRFQADPAVAYAERVEGILRDLRAHGGLPEGPAQEEGAAGPAAGLQAEEGAGPAAGLHAEEAPAPVPLAPGDPRP